MDNLSEKILITELVIKKLASRYRFSNIGVLWSGGKDSTVLIDIIRKIYQNKVPFPVIFNDSTMEFKEIYYFIKKTSKLWNLNLIKIKYPKFLLTKFNLEKDEQKKKMILLEASILSLREISKKLGLKALMWGGRADEFYLFSYKPKPKLVDKHIMKKSGMILVYPILHFSEGDVWSYIRRFKLPYVDLYNRGYRHIEVKHYTKKT